MRTLVIQTGLKAADSWPVHQSPIRGSGQKLYTRNSNSTGPYLNLNLDLKALRFFPTFPYSHIYSFLSTTRLKMSDIIFQFLRSEKLSVITWAEDVGWRKEDVQRLLSLAKDQNMSRQWLASGLAGHNILTVATEAARLSQQQTLNLENILMMPNRIVKITSI